MSRSQAPAPRLLIPMPVFRAMMDHARECLPNECCGLLAGHRESGIYRVAEHYPLVNLLASPREFESEPRGMLAAHRAMRVSGSEVLAIYHSHPTSEPVPSRLDLERSYADDVVNLIIGLRDPEPGVRAWWLRGNSESIEAEWSCE